MSYWRVFFFVLFCVFVVNYLALITEEIKLAHKHMLQMRDDVSEMETLLRAIWIDTRKTPAPNRYGPAPSH
jgi:uncharacterized ion transporter superfamily protein YfcC